MGIDAQSPSSVFAVGSGNTQDEGGPTVILHFNGHTWRKVAQGSFGIGTSPLQQVSSDGHGGLWIPMPGAGGRPSFLVHYSGGRLTEAPCPAVPPGSTWSASRSSPARPASLAAASPTRRSTPAPAWSP